MTIQRCREWLLIGVLVAVLVSLIVWHAGTSPAQAQGDRPPDDPQTAAFINDMFALQETYSGVLCVHGDEECPVTIEVAVPCLTAMCVHPTVQYNVATAYETIQGAVEAAQPGNLVIVMPGTHNGVQVEGTGGADNAYIHIMGWGAPGEVVVDTRAFEDKEWLHDWFYFIDAHHYMISNLTFADADRAGVFVSGYFRETGRFAHHFIFDHITIRDSGVYGLHTTATSHVLIQDSIFVHSQEEHGAYISGSGDDMVIRRNVFQGNAASGFQVNADPQTAAEEVFYFLQNTTGDTCGINEDDLWATQWHDVEACYRAQGLPDLGPYFEDGISKGFVIEQNISTGNGDYGGAGINLASVRHSLVRNNLIYGNAAAGIACWDNGYAADTGVEPSPFGCDDVTINNNTLVDLAGGRGALILNQGAKNMAVFNNIIVRDRFDAYEIAFNSGTNLRSAYNAYFAQFVEESPGALILDTNLQSGSITGFTVQEALAQFVNPDFTPWLRLDGPYPELNPQRPDFHLLPDAAWAVAGNPDLSTPLDLFGRPRAGAELGALTVGGDPALNAHAAGEVPAPAGGEVAAAPAPGMITYLLADDLHIYRLAAAEGAEPEDITAALNALYPGPAEEEWLNVSPDGAWLLTESVRFDPACAGWACLALISADLTTVHVPMARGEVIHVEGFAAVAPDAAAVVYVAGGGPHTRDLWAVFRAGDTWQGPLLLTAESPYAYHGHPAISADGTRVVFDCHQEAYAADGSALCLANIDGSAFTVLLTPDAPPPGAGEGVQLHHPDFAPDGSIIFEADWGGERLWQLAPGTAEPTLITDQFHNDNSPCVLADGRIVSLWLGRPDGEGTHEIKIMTPDGAHHGMWLTGVDVYDVGIGCGG